MTHRELRAIIVITHAVRQWVQATTRLCAPEPLAALGAMVCSGLLCGAVLEFWAFFCSSPAHFAQYAVAHIYAAHMQRRYKSVGTRLDAWHRPQQMYRSVHLPRGRYRCTGLYRALEWRVLGHCWHLSKCDLTMKHSRTTVRDFMYQHIRNIINTETCEG